MKETSILLFVIALLIWNFIAFCFMGWDKHQAKAGHRRVPEKTLFFFAFCLGGPGILAGMRVFRHKTMHWSFRIGVPVAIILDCALFLVLAVWSR